MMLRGILSPRTVLIATVTPLNGKHRVTMKGGLSSFPKPIPGRKKESMKHFSLIVSLLLFVGFALAQENARSFLGLPLQTAVLGFADNDFDYYDSDYGYIHLSRVGDTVTVRLNDIAEGGIKLDFDDDIEELDADDFTEQYIQDYVHLEAGIDIGRRSIELGFEDADLNEVTEFFTTAFEKMDFAPVNVVSSGNTFAFDCGCTGNADYHIRTVFTRLGTTVYVHLSIV